MKCEKLETILGTFDNINELFDAFLKSKYRDMWVTDGILDIYIRKGNRVLEDRMVGTIDIANIAEIDDKYKGQGYFKRFMLHVESTGYTVYVENVTNMQLMEKLEKHGYLLLGTYIGSDICYYKLGTDEAPWSYTRTKDIDNLLGVSEGYR